MAWPVSCVASILFIWVLTKMKMDTVISAFLFSFGVSYVLYFIASFAVAVISSPLASRNYVSSTVIDYNTPVYFIIYSLTSVLQLLISYLIFRVKRFKRGFPFLLKGYAIIIALIAAGVVLVFATWGKTITETDDYSATTFLFAGILIIGSGLYIWVKRGIKAAYLRWAKDHNKELYLKAIAEKDAQIQRLTEFCTTLRSANHSIIHRLAAMERGYVIMLGKAQGGTFAMEMPEELAVSLEDVQRAMLDYQKDAGQSQRTKPLPSTKVKMLDDLFGLFAELCAGSKIDFDLIVTGSIPYMVENIVGQSKLETMIGDHVQDAMIAVGTGDNPFRSILVTLGLVEDCYALTVFDSGIPFDADTLIRLGTECVTTHVDTGGSGEGFMKTFETMGECGASLIINEKEPGSAGYSKSVTIRFDGKRQYIIETYRPGEFPPSDRYTTE